jgi:hypothetical protein
MLSVLTFSTVVLLGHTALAHAQERPRLIVLTDFFKDPDDKQSLIRLLTYANEFEIEGIVATSLAFGDGSIHPEWVRDVLDEYDKVLPNLRKHERPGFTYPSAEALKKGVRAGAPVIRKFTGRNKGFPVPHPPGSRDSRTSDPPEKWIGEGKHTPGSRHIIAVVDRRDPRPVWVTVWGGAMDLAQALWTVRNERSPEEVRRFISKLRVYQVSWQDTGAVWIWENVPELFLILNAETHGGIYGEGPEALRDEAWVNANVRTGHGPLGAGYPKANIAGVKEGDSPSFLHLLARGLSDPERPEWGGWGGRFIRYNDSSNFYVDGGDDHPASSENARRSRWTIGRWNEAISNDFGARMDWCIGSREDANHNPVVVLQKDDTTQVLQRQAPAGTKITLDATGTRDPDGDTIEYQWWHYREAGSYPDAVQIENDRSVRAKFVAPSVTKPQTVHIVLSATDRGSPRLTSYRRIVFTVMPAESASR